MTTPAEGTLLVTAPRERGWRWLVLALAGAVAVTFVSSWPPSLALLGLTIQWLLPIGSFGVLVLSALGACAVASWTRGGRLLPAALVAVALGLWVWRWPPSPTGLMPFEFGWSLLVSAVFGWICMVSSSRPLLSRALLSISGAALLLVVVLSVSARSSGSGPRAVEAAFTQQLASRRDRALAVWRGRVSDPAWLALGARVPAVAQTGNRVVQQLAEASPPVAVVPALLVLETIAALALAWAAWHRLTRFRLGPPLASLTKFRFNDQLVWGLVVGATMVLLPSLEGWWTVGVNLLLVFGALHALRGLGVLLWWIPDRWAVVPLLLVLVCIPLLGPVQVLATVAVLALGLGLGDTWRDFRRTARPLRPDPRP